jgi:hypothetical protein
MRQSKNIADTLWDSLKKNGYDLQRPHVRRDCLPGGMNEERPCPWVACKHHLYLDCICDSRSIEPVLIANTCKNPENMEHSCVLDLVENNKAYTLEYIGGLLGIVRERVRQLEDKALARAKENAEKKHTTNMLIELIRNNKSSNPIMPGWKSKTNVGRRI